MANTSQFLLLEAALAAMSAPFASNAISTANSTQKSGSEFSAADFRLLMTQFGDNPIEEDDCNNLLDAFINSNNGEAVSQLMQKYDTSSDGVIATSEMLEWLTGKSGDVNEESIEESDQPLNIDSALRLLVGPGGSLDYDSMLELLSSQEGEALLREEEIRKFLDEVQASGKDGFSLNTLANILKTDKVVEQTKEQIPEQSSDVRTPRQEGKQDLYYDVVQSPRTTSPLYDHSWLSGKYAKAIERGAFKKPKQDAKAEDPCRDRVQSPRATSPLYDHSWLSGKYAKAIERGAFKNSKFEIKIANEVNAPTVDAVLIQLSIEHLIVVVLLYPASAHIPRPLLCHEAHFSVNCSPHIHM